MMGIYLTTSRDWQIWRNRKKRKWSKNFSFVYNFYDEILFMKKYHPTYMPLNIDTYFNFGRMNFERSVYSGVE